MTRVRGGSAPEVPVLPVQTAVQTPAAPAAQASVAQTATPAASFERAEAAPRAPSAVPALPVPERPVNQRSVSEAVERLHRAMKGMGTDEDAIFRVLESRSPAELRAIEAEFGRRHGVYWGGDLRVALKDELSGGDLERALSSLDLAHNAPGPMEPRRIAAIAKALDGAMRGLGTDEDGVWRVLERCSPQQLRAVEDEFARAYGKDWGGSLRSALAEEMSGDDLARALRSLDAAQSAPSRRELRARVESVLTKGADDAVRMEIGERELGVATPAEKAQLVGKLLDGFCGDDDELAILRILETMQGPERAGFVQALGRAGRLNELLDDVHGDEYARLREALPDFGTTPDAAVGLVRAFARGDSDESRLAVHHVLDAARAAGCLPETLRRLEGEGGMVHELAAQAQPTRRPRIIAHRGGVPTELPENTIPAIKEAFRRGADGTEIDITMTKDGRIVLWHDYDQGSLVSIVRNLGLESGNRYRPTFANLFTDARRPIYELDLATLRANYGYKGPEGQAQIEIPVLEQVVEVVREQAETPEIVLDIKLPPDRPDLARAMARQIRTQLGDLKDRVLIMHNDARVVSAMREELGPSWHYTHDVEMVSLLPNSENYSAVASARALGNDTASIGVPRIGIGAYGEYLESLRRDRAAIDAEGGGRRLITWTVSDELRLREIIAVGVDGILTDDPEGMARLLDKLGL